uniref:Uncharacterized protein n=1 Tax=Odontella aurita TaxID=265563 RepID=A0A7S4K9I6_9STRA|mmetsp:Transcript_7535/g.22086  ORF Transcript_7535/g.22086 Transcript_7535/m.22086 type:complete len:557 (+) Transcript_7535:360-2030(+)
MIVYDTSLWGFRILLRGHGSALYKAFLPATVSTAILLGIYFGNSVDFEDRSEYKLFDHPYALGVFVVAYTFTLTFKLSFSYNRYWEACTAIHQMHSKWLDVGMEMAAFHLQSNKYKAIMPPAFGEHPEITSVRRQRSRVHEKTAEDVEKHLDSIKEPTTMQWVFNRKKGKSFIRKNRPSFPQAKNINLPGNAPVGKTDAKRRSSGKALKRSKMNKRLQSVAVLDGGIKTKEPALFLQELTHLLSLLSAVAFSTLRNDNEETESPLVPFEPGTPWQPVDPDDVNDPSGGLMIRKEYYRSQGKFWNTTKYLLSISDRSEKGKAMYNLARPFRVIGGVSDAEIQLLQCARGPLAKVALCSMWLQEFISREYLNGSTGPVAPPIISRLFQYTSDGMVGYNQARKVAYIPFPFPHNQVTAFFTLFTIVYLPVLFLTYIRTLWTAIVMNLFASWCFCALYEVARELERPFQNVPNDIPLNNLQHQFNEALQTTYFGFHPDAWWEIEGKVKTPTCVRLPSGSEHNEQLEEAVENLAGDINAEATEGTGLNVVFEDREEAKEET